MSARFTLFSAATAVVLAPLLYDAALKGVLLLAAAGLVVLGLRRASAAARHLVWLVAMVALLVVPVLTVALPRWRVLPAWTAWPKPPADAPHRHPVADPGPRVATGTTAPPMRESPAMTSKSAPAPIVSLPERPGTAPSLPARVPVRAPAPRVSAATWAVAAWTAGFLLFSVRLLAAHCLLRRTRRRAEPCPSGPLAEALAEAARQLGVRSPVSLRLDARRTIPLVWGVLRPCLLLPAEARDWSRDQLRSVLLHELAHLKRRDPLVQALGQIALALHWFNPLAWLAVWRLHVERERACDDLVLASGVRSSEYATHLLRVATDLTPAPWTSACGLAMARRSSLEARLRAVLNDRCNRRSMTRALTAAALFLSLVIAIPVAMLRATEETWNPPNAAHIVTNAFSAYCVHGVKDAAFILAYPGQTSSSSAHDSNSQTRTWTDTGTFTAIQPDIAIGFFRQHTAPDTLVLTTTPASARYLSKTAPPPRPFGQRTFDLKQGRVFLLAENATIRQLDLPAPLVTDTASATQLAALIAALPPPAPETQSAKPTAESAQSLFQKWQSRARTNGQIPGALIRQLSRQVTEFITQYPDTDEAKKLATLRPRFEAAAARDWGPAEAAGLLDDVAAITTAPLDWSSLPMEFDAFSVIKTGEPMPAELASAAWGPPAENGLRAAWLLEPRAEQYALGSVLKVRVLFHNAGTKPVVFRTETWHQSDTLTVRDAQGADVKTTGTWYTGLTPLANYRLLPGEYCEVSAPGVAIGAGTYEDERSTGGLGVVIEAKERDELSLSCLVDAAQGITFSRPNDPTDPLELWKKQVADRIASEAPLPQSPADREQLIRRVLLDLTGVPPTAEEIAQFIADPAPDALDTLTARLQAKEPTLPWTGKLTTGTTQVRVLAADPEAAKAPRSANGPGRYVLGDSAHLIVRQVTEGGKYTNEAEIVFFGPDPKKESPHEPLPIALPDGIGTYGIVWERGAGELWVLEKDLARQYTFTNPSQVNETRITSGGLGNIPPHLQGAMKQAFNAAGTPSAQQTPEKDSGAARTKPAPLGDDALNLPEAGPGPREPGRLKPDTEQKLAWGEPVNGLRAALVRVPPEPQLQPGTVVDLNVVVQNVSDRTVAFRGGSPVAGAALRTVLADGRTTAVNQNILDILSSVDAFTLAPREVAVMSLMSVLIGELTADSRSADPNRSVGYSTGNLANGAAVAGFSASLSFEHAPDHAFKGTLQTGTLMAAVTAAPPVQHNPPATPLDPKTEAQLDWGEAVNGLRGALLIRSPGAGRAEGIDLVVQNVSDAPMRFVDTVKTDRLRTLYLSDTKGVLAGLSNDEPTMTDVTLQPREVVFISMMRGDSSPEVVAGLIEGLRKDSLQTWRAVLRMNQAPEGWQGELTTGETRGAVREGGPQPTNDRAQALFKHWQNSARLNGDIPGGLVPVLHEKVKEFIRNNEPDASGGPYAQKMKPLEPRFAHTGDWKPADAVALLDDIAAAHTIPLETTLQHLTERTLQPGTPLPASLQNADWGEPLPSGLRMAHVLEPRSGGYPLGTELKARLVFHNAGPEPVAFLTTTFQQPGHAAKRADGTDLTIDSTEWLTLGRLAAYRLAPGDYCEIHTPGLGIGARDNDRGDWANVRAGSWILCTEGDEVIFTPGAATLGYRDMAEPPADWWLDFITERLNREAPVPTDTKEREYLLYRVVRDLYGAAPSTTQGDAFAADTSPDALKNLAALLAKHPYGKRSDGLIRAGSTKFRVLPPDTDAAQRPRVATGPGWYSLSDSVKFSVTRRATGSRVRNEANLIYFQQGQENVAHKITLPDDHDTWAAASMKGATILWIAEAGTLLRYDFSNPLKVEETRYEAGKLGEAPISKELRAALDTVLLKPAPDAPKLNQPTSPAAEAPTAPPSEKSDTSHWDIRQHDGRDYVTLESFAKFYRLMRTERVADGFKLSSSQMAIAGTLGRPVVTINGISFALDHPIVEVANALLVSRADVGLLFDPVLRPHAQNANFNGTVILDPTGDGLNLAMVWAREVQNKLSAAGFTVLLTRGAEARGDAEASLRLAAAHPGAVVLGLDFKEESDAEIRGPETKVMSTAVPESLRKVSCMLATAVHGHMRTKLAAEDRGIRSADGPLLTQSTIPAIVLEAGCLSNDRNSNQWNDPAFRGRAAEAVTAGMKAFQRSVNAPRTRTGAEGSPEKRGTATLTPEALLGTWRGMVNNERLMLSFHRPPAETEVQLDIYFGDATIGALATFTLAEDGGSAEVVQASAGGGMKFGTLVPSEAGQLKLELYGRQKGQQEVMLTRDADAVATEPRQVEARQLFEIWKRTANADGTIPGPFIGMLATEVRAYVKANPTLDSAANLPKLLPRFVTSRDWTNAEAITLLDDVAYYTTEPITARVAKAKLPSGPLWRTMVEFQDIPVEIEKWSDPLRGLRIGMRVLEADWHLGGRARLELWLHNVGDQDVTFKSTGPDRQDVGVSVAAIGTDGREHWSSERSVLIIAPPTDCTLPPGHVAMAKSFEVWISRPDDTSAEWKALNLRDLPAGDYRLRCSWLDAAGLADGAEWQGTLTAPELEFTLAPQVPKSAVAPAPTGVPGGPRAEVKPERTHLWNDTYAAVGYQTEKDVHFVLATEGFISTGLSESYDTSKRWTIEGNIHLVDPEKTKAAGKNVDKRVIALKHTSDEPTKLYLDGKAYDLSASTTATPTGALPPPGRLFILREDGEPIQTARTLPLRNEQDLATIGDSTADVRATLQN